MTDATLADEIDALAAADEEYVAYIRKPENRNGWFDIRSDDDLAEIEARAKLLRASAAALRSSGEKDAEIGRLRGILRSGTVGSVCGGDLVETIELRPAPAPRDDGCDFLLIPITDDARAALQEPPHGG